MVDKFTPEEAKKVWSIAYWTDGLKGEEIKVIENYDLDEIEMLRVHKDFFDGDWKNLVDPHIDDIIINKTDFEKIKKLFEGK